MGFDCISSFFRFGWNSEIRTPPSLFILLLSLLLLSGSVQMDRQISYRYEHFF